FGGEIWAIFRNRSCGTYVEQGDAWLTIFLWRILSVSSSVTESGRSESKARESVARKRPNHLHVMRHTNDTLMSRVHGTYVPSSVARTTDRPYLRVDNNKKLETPWSRRAQHGIHGLCTAHCRQRRLRR